MMEKKEDNIFLEPNIYLSNINMNASSIYAVITDLGQQKNITLVSLWSLSRMPNLESWLFFNCGNSNTQSNFKTHLLHSVDHKECL